MAEADNDHHHRERRDARAGGTTGATGNTTLKLADSLNEYLAGLNFYPLDTRQHRLNFQVMDVNRSPVSSTFGYHVGGQTGTTCSVAFSIVF